MLEADLLRIFQDRKAAFSGFCGIVAKNPNIVILITVLDLES
jgi:hypothetical protein